MPVIMLLRGLTASLRATARALTPWLEIVEHESAIVERGRAAFLVHWWGFETPVTRLNLSGHVVNIGELEERFLAAGRSVPVGPGGPNAVGSLLGLAGRIAGMALDPLYAAAGIYLLMKISGFSGRTLALAVLWAVPPLLLLVGLVLAPAGTAVLVGGGLSAAGFGYGLLAALGDRREVRAAFALFGSLTRLFLAARELIGQVLGDRMRNPLTAGLAVLWTRLGRLLGQALGAVAVLVVRVGPELAPAAALIGGLVPLAGAVGAATAEVAASATAQVDGALSAEHLLVRVTGVVRKRLTAAGTAFGQGLHVLETGLTAVAGKLSAPAFSTELASFVGLLVSGHPTVRVVAGLRAEAEIFTAAVEAAPKPEKKDKKEKEPGPSRLAPLIAALPELPTVSFPALPVLPDVTVPPPAPVLDVPFAVTIPSVRVRGVPGLALPELPRSLSAPVDLTPLKAIVGRLLPEAFQGPVREKVDRLLSEFPVAELPESDVLRPEVHRLRLRVPGAAPDEARRFRDVLLARLREQPYATGAGG
ncbi:hypothetical protein ACFYXJ_25695 [Streptomyces sp. NPDC002667]|uniref:hypothetical protein n=1 Tax=Streptomyces sp. NPDC002667 TaxID=3364657 RepID=UPI003681544F